MTSPQREPGSGRTERPGAGLRPGTMVNQWGSIRAVHNIVTSQKRLVRCSLRKRLQFYVQKARSGLISATKFPFS